MEESTRLGVFRPGDSRINRRGRIDGGRYGELQKLAQAVLDEDREIDGRRVSAITAILRGMVDKALSGDTKATEIVLLAAYGKPPTKCDVEVETEVKADPTPEQIDAILLRHGYAPIPKLTPEQIDAGLAKLGYVKSAKE